MTVARRGLAALALTLALSGGAFAQAWPNRPIRMIVPYTPGGYTDFMARTVGQQLSEVLGQPFVFENRPGANSVIAAHAVNASINPRLPYDVLKDFSSVSLMSVAPLLMVAHPALPANNVREL